MSVQKSNNAVSDVRVNSKVLIRIFSSREEAEFARTSDAINRIDKEKFSDFCRLMRIGNMLRHGANAAGKSIIRGGLDKELLEFWGMLNKHNVAYIMVGDFAVTVQGFDRATKNVELWLRDDLLNRRSLRIAFADLGYGDFLSIETMDFFSGLTRFFIAGGLDLNIVTEVKGIENHSFEDCLKRADVLNLFGIIVPFLGLTDLIANKKAVLGPIDQIDLLELEKIKKIREQEETRKKG